MGQKEIVLTLEMRARIRIYRSRGEPWLIIAKRFGVCQRTMVKWKNSMNLPPELAKARTRGPSKRPDPRIGTKRPKVVVSQPHIQTAAE